ncbi:hypothetical protein FKO01_59825 [Mesorhizobium sp. B2-3-3]|uniref:hypothetical protein n=1 Tax=unclassified Mesorhizobium TaxID=325217 RepID=UPI0011299D3D|nr:MULTISPECIES: hypothetical protein [unclassified Mesorhizobium]TPK61144.1 hypothetical protein FJ930_27830 [Mesorhizobium sp. B2-4-15]TPM17161.1 hypothetical protein FJ958_28565 [Mesorhizobium sp. B2-3-5]TPM84150.1 hypothetical protein FKO01_59825 [Mesorhizobium sp. B2-3-3]
MTNTFHTITFEGAARAISFPEAELTSYPIAQAFRAIETLMPACKATHHNLEEMRAAACIIHNVPAAFDAIAADCSETRH